MWCVRHNLLAVEDASLDELANLMMADTELCGGIAQRQPLAILLGGAVAVDAAYTAERADAVRCPGLALAGRHSHSVQRGGDVLIGPSACHAAHDGERLLGCATPVFPGSRLVDAQLGMLAALPVDDEHDLTGRLVDIDDDLSDQCPHQSLARPHHGSRRLPCRREIIGQSGEVGTHIVGIRHLHSIEPLPATLDTLQRSLPRLLQLRCDQAIVGVASGIAAFSERCIVLGLLQLQLGDTPPVLILVFEHPFGLLSRLDRHWRYGAQHLGRDGLVDALAGDAQATPLAQLHVRLFAPVDRPRIATGVENAEPTTAARTADETGQQGAPASSRLRVPNPAVGVAREQRLIAFVLRPTDVALVMILDEYLPRTHRLAVAIALARTTIDDRGALLALAVSVDAGIEGILQNRDDVTIPDWPPFERCQRPAVRRVGKVDVLRRHPQQHLAGAPEFTELLKDKPDHLLQPPIRIEAEANVPVPSVTDWTRDPQLAAPGLRSCCLVHPRSDDPQLELADAPLHAEQ